MSNPVASSAYEDEMLLQEVFDEDLRELTEEVLSEEENPEEFIEEILDEEDKSLEEENWEE